MKKDEVERILKEQKPYLEKQFFVKKIGIFGSYARDQHTNDSDIDILVEFNQPVGFEFIELKDYLETILNKSIDLVTVKALKPYMRDEILSEVQYQ